MPSVRDRIAVLIPQIGSYGRYQGHNYGLNTLEITFGPLTIYFSYKTCVAFQLSGYRKVVRRNEWGRTTGKHLTWIDGRKTRRERRDRVDEETFEKLWKEQVEPILTGTAHELLPDVPPEMRVKRVLDRTKQILKT